MTTAPRVCSVLVLAAALLAPACGYHLGGQGDLIPKNIKTIAIPSFINGTVRVQIAALLTADVVREFESRTKYVIVTDPKQADAVLSGSVVRFDTLGGITTDPVTGRATSSQIIVTVSFKLTDNHTGKVLFNKTGYEFRERYEIASDLPQYFDESNTAVKRACDKAALAIVALILEAF